MSQPRIVTPEAVVLDFERAGVASRTLAISLDLLALAATWAVLFWLAVLAFGSAESVAGAVVAVFFSLALYLAWFAGFETYLQRTPGKMALGLRAVSLDGTPVRFQQAFLRALLGIIDFFLFPLGGVAVVTCLLSPTDQRLGDMAAGTVVVRQRSVEPMVAPARFRPPPGMEDYTRTLDVSRMTERQYVLVRRFLLRAHDLVPLARGQVAVTLANPLARILGHVPPPTLHPELFLVCLAAGWQAAHGVPQAPDPWAGQATWGGSAYGRRPAPPQPAQPPRPTWPAPPPVRPAPPAAPAPPPPPPPPGSDEPWPATPADFPALPD